MVVSEQAASVSFVKPGPAVQLRERVLLPFEVVDIVHQARPAREAVLARDDELRVGEQDFIGVRSADPGVLRTSA